MNKEIIEKVLLEISTPTGLTYSGDVTICNDEAKDIINYIDNLEQQVEKQKEVIDKAIDKLYSIPIETTRQEVIDIARETLHILKEVEQCNK